ncbi:unnamed protein product [Rotaria magnacalcarata]|uniref:Bulb-type lectin domain-containing protein n=4 Tax=Rotaria magnacalcarata TaxID=392030 RepID=A0A8S2N3K7_9BILA|nr:unnamed protein product [Rotaria magnacalcarata]
MAVTTSCGYEPMRSGTTILCYINRDGLPLSDRCTERMWSFCMEQYAKNVTDIEILRNQIDDYPPVTHPDPPYHIATSTRLTVAEKLQQIQNYIQRLEYNYTGMQFFYLNPNRSIYGLMDKARYIMTESLPIKCFEAFLIGLYLTTGIVGLDRFNISFKTRFNSVLIFEADMRFKHYYRSKDMTILFVFILVLFIGCSIGESPRFYSSDTLGNGATLYQEGYLGATNDAYFAIMQRDGNLVVYTSRDFSPVNAQWSSNSTGKGQEPFRLIMQDSGNLLIRDAKNQLIWSTRTAGKGVKPHYLVMQIDRNLVLYDGHHQPIWASNTTKW